MSKKTTHTPANRQPPEGWKDGEGFGLLYGRDTQGQPVDLVRLADLVRWIQTDRRISRKEALQVVIDALPADTLDWLYKLRPSDAAVLVGEDATFGQRTREAMAKAMAARNKNLAWVKPSVTREW